MLFNVPAEILKQTTKCPSDFSCLETGRCSDRSPCDVERPAGENVLWLRSKESIDCPYHMDFGKAKICVCPVHYWIHQQQTR